MARPSRTGGKSSAATRRKASSAKGRNPAKAKRGSPPAIRSNRSSVSGSSKELREAREQQAATAEILKVIANSPSDVQPVFEAIATSAKRLIGGFSCTVIRFIDGMAHLKAFTPTTAKADEILQSSFPQPVTLFLPWHRAQAGKVTHVPDTEAMTGGIQRISRARGFRSMLFVPLMNKGEAIGTISVTRAQPGTFADHHVQLLKTFADQAVIAIENTRLFNEVEQRTEELSELLQQQTAVGDVLKTISRSAFDVHAVLRTLVGSAVRLCQAETVQIFLRDGEVYRPVAHNGFSPEYQRYAEENPIAPGRGTLVARTALELATVHIPDVLLDTEYTWHEGRKLGRFRAMLGVPLLREQNCIGVMAMTRLTARPFTDRQIELVRVFADQAVIAIENARLFEELRDRQAELRVTFDNMGDGVVMFDAQARLAAWNRNLQEMLELPDAFLGGRPSYADYFRYLADRGEYSSALEEQLSRTVEDTRRELRFERTRPDGRVIEVRRKPVPDGGFVLIYADITERKRAEEAIRLARDAAEKALRDLQTAQDRLVQTQKLASLGQLTAGIAHEIKNPLNFVNNFSALSVELADELNEVMKQVTLTDKAHKEVDELTALLKDNLGKVVQHGKRADSIVKNMLLHSREGSGEQRAADINSLVDESLNLAYHGARAEKSSFNITLERDFDPAVGVADIYPQEITRVLLNLISNGFYAATQRAGTAGNGSEPRLKAVTRNIGDMVEVRIRDNGAGIPSNIQEKIFNPFFTTKPAGEGTGLGLSLSHDIVVKQHGGTIDVVTEPGSFTEFIIRLPRVMPTQAEARGQKK